MGNVRSWIRRRPWLVALGAAAVVALAAVGVAASRSLPQGGCSTAPPLPDLPAQLRSLGGFDQPFAASETRTLQDAALRAASAIHSDLSTTVVGDPVAEAGPAGQPDAIVLPLLTNPGPDGRYRTVEGLAAFLRACGGLAYYHDVTDLAAAPPAAYPALPQEAAARLLGAGTDMQLVWVQSPFEPAWRGPGGCVAATAAPVAGCRTAPLPTPAVTALAP